MFLIHDFKVSFVFQDLVADSSSIKSLDVVLSSIEGSNAVLDSIQDENVQDESHSSVNIEELPVIIEENPDIVSMS